MKKLVIVLVATSLILILFVGCTNGLQSGTVYDKKHRSSYTTIQAIPKPKGGFYYIPKVHPEEWEIFIRDNGKTEELNVSESVWNSVKIGDYYSAQ